MWKPLALVAACTALVLTPYALAQTGANPTPTQPSTDSTCTPLKKVYSESNWRERKPARGVQVCPVENHAGARNTVHHFYLWRAFRKVAPYSGYRGRGKWLTHLAIPRYIVDCESGGSWYARNPSGATGPAQLLGWGAPDPARTAEEKVRYWKIAASVWSGGSGASNWECA